MWNEDVREAMRLHKQLKGVLPTPAQQQALLAQAKAARKMMPTPDQVEAYRRQAEWAREMAMSIDPATLRALREAYSSRKMLETIEVARSVLGERGLAAAQVLTDRELFFRPYRLGGERDSEDSPWSEAPSPERIRRAEKLAASDEVRDLLSRATPKTIEEEAEAYIESEEPFALADADAEEIVLYGVDIKLSEARRVVLVLLIALHAAGIAPELAAQIRQALDDLVNVVGGLGWLLWSRKERGAAPEGSGVAGEDLLRFAGSIDTENLDEMERAIEEDCERISPVER